MSKPTPWLKPGQKSGAKDSNMQDEVWESKAAGKAWKQGRGSKAEAGQEGTGEAEARQGSEAGVVELGTMVHSSNTANVTAGTGL